jgi:hypothetical protein
MDKNIKNQIMLAVMILVVSESLGEIEKKEDHSIENQFPHDTTPRIYLTSVASITASPATDLDSTKTIQDFMHK